MKKSIILSLLLVVISAMTLHAEGGIDTVWHKPLDFVGAKFAGMKISPDGSKVILAIAHSFFVYDTENGDFIREIETDLTGQDSFIDFEISDDWKYLVFTGGNSRFYVYDFVTGEKLDHYDYSRRCSMTPDGNFAIIATYNGYFLDKKNYLYKYDLSTLSIVDTLEYPYETPDYEPFTNLYISPDSRYFFYEVCNYDSWEEECTYEVWIADMQTFEPLKVVRSTDYQNIRSALFFNTKNVFSFYTSGFAISTYNYDNFKFEFLNIPVPLHMGGGVRYSKDDKYGLFDNGGVDVEDRKMQVWKIDNEEIIFEAPFTKSGWVITTDNEYIIAFSRYYGLTKIRAPWQTVGISEDEKITNENLNYNNGNIQYEYYLDKPTNIRISIHDVTGRIINELVNEFQSDGQHSLNTNIELPSGSYFLLIEKDGEVSSKQFFVVN